MEALRERFGKYHVLEKIAQGGMAEVYKVKSVGIAGFEKIQALKRILPHSAREQRFIRSFIDEARIAVELTHRNIVQVFDFGKADGELFMAMELIEGKDLRTVVQQAVAADVLCPIPVAAYLVGEVAAGLDYAHRKTDGFGSALGIVHCDVSPSNVMLSNDGYVKILDFGIARATFSSALERKRLRGKPRYMAPEQTYGEPATMASDVFALGIIAWELFTGLPLFRGPDLKAILEAVRRTEPPRIERMNPKVPRELCDAVARALTRDPAGRGQAADLAHACMRTAMLAGARQLAEWLADIASRPSAVVIHDPVPAAKAPRGKTVESLGSAGPRSDAEWRRGDGIDHHTGAFAEEIILLTTVKREGTAQGVPMVGAFADRDPTGSHTAMPVMEAIRPSTEAILAHTLDVDSVIAPPPAFVVREATTASSAPAYRPETAPPERMSSTEIVSSAVLPFQSAGFPSSPFDDDAGDTKAMVAVPRQFEGATPAPTSRVAIGIILDSDSADDEDWEPIELGREPIDDDLGALAHAAPVERRRAVIVAAFVDGPDPKPVTRTVGELAYQRGGVVVEKTDEALVVAFGLEVAGEDDVAIAMGWALDAGAMVRDTGHQLRTGARTGVTTSGPLIARGSGPIAPVVDLGTQPGIPSALAGASGNARIPSDATDEARALARDAQPDRPLFIGAAGRLTSSLYALREVPAPRRVARRSKVIEVVGPRTFDERERARLELRGKLVGREAQLVELEKWFAQAATLNQRFAVAIVGTAGTGKSRLVAELVARHPEASAIVSGASPASRLAPFAMLVDLYQAALGFPPVRGRAARVQVVQRLLHVMARSGLTAERARAIATDLDRAMELRDGSLAGAQASSRIAPEVADLRPRASAGLAAFRAAAAVKDKVRITILEDIHLSDAPSLEVLRHVLAVRATGPELLIVTARPDGPALPPVDATIQVGDLVGTELRMLAADRLGDAASPATIAAVLARGGGNPLFVEELAQAVRDSNSLDIPATARDVVAARLDRFSARVKALLHYAALIGSAIRVRLVEELVDGGDLAPEIEELVAAGILVRDESGGVEFARGLVREVIYDAMPLRAQRDGHRRVGRLLASRFFAGRDEAPAPIADHLERGGEAAGACAFWLRAGRAALAASDADTAIACFTRCLNLERDLGTTPPTPTSRARRRDALAGRDEAHRLRGDLDADASDLDELHKLCDGDAARLADVALRRASRLVRLGDFASASLATTVAEERATAGRDPRQRGEALRIRGEVLERLGRFDEALKLVDAARGLFAKHGFTAEEMAAMVGCGRIHLMCARYEAAREAYRPVLGTDDPGLERLAQNHVAVIELCLGNFVDAMARAQRSLELSRRHGDRAREGDALGVTGVVLYEVGCSDEAAARFAEAIELLARASSRWSRADFTIYAGACEVRRGRSGGFAMLDDALGEARKLGARYLECHALVARAGANLRAGFLEAAVADATAGLSLARASALVGFEIQALARHALATARGGRPVEAVANAERALELLDRQKFIEGSEEAVCVACAEVFRQAGAGVRADAAMARARAGYRRKLEGLMDETWRAAFAAIPEHRGL